MRAASLSLGLGSLVVAACGAGCTGGDPILPDADAGLAGLVRCVHSPDGSRIAGFTREATAEQDPYGALRLTVVAAAGGASRTLGEERFDAMFTPRPSWSPQGTLLAVVQWPFEELDAGGIRLWVHDLAAGSSATVWTAASGATVHAAPAWSPDGRALAVASQDRGIDLWVVAREGESLWHDRIDDASWGWASVAYSPDGTQIALAGCHRFLVYDAASGERVLERELAFVDSESSTPPIGLADGRWVVRAGNAVWLVDRTKPDRRLFSDAPIVDLVRWPGSARVLGLRERSLEPSGVVGGVQVLLGAGHAPDRYETRPMVHDLGKNLVLELDALTRVGATPWEELDLDAHPAVRQVFSRWR